MKQIKQFTIQGIQDRVQIIMPEPAKILHVADYFGDLKVWAIVDDDPTAPEVTRYLRIVGGLNHTEIPLPDETTLQYLATVMMHSGSQVWFIFEDMA